jgi:hypothetical protein
MDREWLLDGQTRVSTAYAEWCERGGKAIYISPRARICKGVADTNGAHLHDRSTLLGTSVPNRSDQITDHLNLIRNLVSRIAKRRNSLRREHIINILNMPIRGIWIPN